jgi:zinc D-Ala-D-Ala carboxypeptidase
MQLSNNFSLEELIHSNTAIAKKIDQTPSAEVIENLTLLARQVLQPIRIKFGPVKISSGYRSEKLNKALKGAKNSQHVTGNAADIDLGKEMNKQVFEWIRENLDWDQLIDENDFSWVHVSIVAKGNRREVLQMKDGKYIKL